jgi:hypothetical protein
MPCCSRIAEIRYQSLVRNHICGSIESNSESSFGTDARVHNSKPLRISRNHCLNKITFRETLRQMRYVPTAISVQYVCFTESVCRTPNIRRSIRWIVHEKQKDCYLERRTEMIVWNSETRIHCSGLMDHSVDTLRIPPLKESWKKNDWSSVNFTNVIRESIPHWCKFFTWWDFAVLGVESSEIRVDCSSDICEEPCSYRIK